MYDFLFSYAKIAELSTCEKCDNKKIMKLNTHKMNILKLRDQSRTLTFQINLFYLLQKAL